MKDYHHILGVRKGASQDEIKSAYRQAVLKYHPDRKGTPSQRFYDIQEAYEVLTGKKQGASHSDLYSSLIWRLQMKEYALVPNVIRMNADKRVVRPQEKVNVTFVLTGIGKIVYIKGLHSHFDVIEGPKVQSGLFQEGKKINVKWFYTYTLQPKKKGYLTLGPCLAVVNGKKIRSSPFYIKASNHINTQSSSRIGWRYYSYVALLFVIIAIGSVIANQLIPKTEPGANLRKAQPVNKIFDDQLDTESSGTNHLQTGSSPLDSYLENIALDEGSGNMIRFINGPYYDALVCLADAQTGEVVRNVYIRAGDVYEMNDIKKGTYFLRLIKGHNWVPDKEAFGKGIRGGFQYEKVTKKFEDQAHRFHMDQTDKDGNARSVTYRVKLYSTANGNMKGENVSPEQILDGS